MLGNPSGDLRLICSNAQGEYELLTDSIRAKSPELLAEGIRPNMLVSLSSDMSRFELALAAAGGAARDNFSRRSVCLLPPLLSAVLE